MAGETADVTIGGVTFHLVNYSSGPGDDGMDPAKFEEFVQTVQAIATNPLVTYLFTGITTSTTFANNGNQITVNIGPNAPAPNGGGGTSVPGSSYDAGNLPNALLINLNTSAPAGLDGNGNPLGALGNEYVYGSGAFGVGFPWSLIPSNVVTAFAKEMGNVAVLLNGSLPVNGTSNPDFRQQIGVGDWSDSAINTYAIGVENIVRSQFGIHLRYPIENGGVGAEHPLFPDGFDTTLSKYRTPKSISSFGFTGAQPHFEPLVLNLTANSAPETTSLWSGTQFDLQNNGFEEQTGWVGANSGLLVYDPTGGAITNGSQLFGTSYSLSGGGYAVDGFAALADLDSNSSGVINSSDTHWGDLRVWVDSNINGVVDSGELETMSAAGISSFSLTTSNTDTTDANGNYIGKTATYSLVGGGTHEFADVSFDTDPYLTTPDSTVSLDGTVSLLPEITGSGTVASLQQAMQVGVNGSDTTLEESVQDFVAATDDATRNTLVDEIIYEWTGVAGVSPTARGTYFDARQLEALEHFSGQAYIDPFNSTSNPGSQSVPYLTAAFQELHTEVFAELEKQTDLASLFNDIQQSFDDTNAIVSWNFLAAETEILNDLSANRASGLVTLTDFNQALHAFGMDTDSGFATFRSDLAAQGADVAATFLYGTKYVYGTAGDDVITAWAGNQTVFAQQGGNDTLIGSGDNELFYGSGGSNLFIGGVGNDEEFIAGNNQSTRYGGDPTEGADTFIAGQGTETFSEGAAGHVTMYYAAGDGNLTINNYGDQAHQNLLILDSSIDRSSVSLSLFGNGFQLADGVGGDQITITSRAVAALEFADGTTIDLVTSAGIQAATTGATLSGNQDDNIYSYDPGTGLVTLSDSGGNNELWLGGTLTAGNLSYSTSGNHLLITDGVGGDQITDKNYGVQTIMFSDGSTVGLLAAGNTYTLSGGTTSTGTGTNDIYSFAASLGTATISDPGGLDTLKFGSGISAGGLGFTGSGNDLLITDGIGGDKVVIQGQLSAAVIETIKFNDNSTLDLTAGLNLAEAAGQSLLNGTTGNDTLTGNSGSQTLNGNGGNDVFINGSGPTTVNGGVGDDTYSYASGSGALTINETGGANTVILGSGITTGNTSLIASGHDLLITDSVSGDTITLKDQLDTAFTVDSLVFNGGTTWTLEGIALTANAGILYGTPGDDTLTATSGTETLIGNSGNDTFIGAAGTESLMGNGNGGSNVFVIGTGKTTAYGGAGNDTYSYASGDGALTVNEEGGQNTIVLAAGLTAGSLTFTASGHDLLITDGVGGDTITLKNQLADTDGVQTIEFSDTSTESIEGLALTMPGGTSLLYGTSGNDTLTATSGTETINGNGGNDIFIDAGGNLTAIGGNGNDAYSYISGSGLLIIQDSVGTNTIKLGSGITTGNVSLTASGHDLLITDSVGGDTLTLKNQLTTGFGITDLVFSGGTTENLEGLTLTANASIQYGTIGNDTLTATTGTETLTGNGGNDKFVGASGTDTMNGGSGSDTFIGSSSGVAVMSGNGGNDIFEGSGGNDTMNGSTGNDSFIASTGTEKMTGGGGNDVFIAGGGSASATGSTGNDLYSFASGGGNLIISDAGGTDTLKLGSGLTAGNVVISESTNGHDLLITDGVGGDQITISGAVSTADDRVETLVYGDASTQNLTSGLTLTAQTGSSTLIAAGFGGNNTLIAVASGSTETLEGGSGNDTYSYSSGDAAVYISEGGNGGTDTLKMGSGLTSSNVSLSMTNGADLLVADGTGGDLVTIHDEYTSGYSIEILKYGDGTSISLINGVKISATSGTATVSGTTGADTLIGTTGTQSLNGNGGTGDTFIGGTGTQTLNGVSGANDFFIAGSGPQTALGGTGNDVYSYASGDGNFTIDDSGGTDTLKLASGLNPGSLTFTESTNGHDLIITDGTGGDQITIPGDINNSGDRIETLIYGNGTTLDLTSGLTLTATTGSSTLVAIGGNNTLLAVSGANTETLEGNTGNDLYSYASGTGKVYINDSGGTDTLKFGSGLTSANIVYTESSNGADLLITDGVSGDTVTLHNEIRSGSSQIENFVYGDGSTATLSSIVLTASAGNTTLNGTAGNDILVGTTGNQTIIGAGGSDVFNGGTGTQTLDANSGTGNNIYFAAVGVTSAIGRGGNDTYNYASGDGLMTISDSGGTDTLILGSGLTASNVSLSESTNGHDLLITDGVGGDKITVPSGISTSGDRVETLVYGDGSTQNLTSGMTLYATTGSSTLTAIAGNNTLIAAASGSTETLQGNSGNDTYSYASGDGSVYITELGLGGTDTLKLGSGLTSSNVSLSETNGADLLITDGTGGDQITIHAPNTSGYQIETLVYGDGSSISLVNGIIITATSGTATVTGTTSNDTLIGSTGTQTLSGNGGNDSFIGGTGTQTLVGGTGNDVFFAGVGTTSATGSSGNDLYSYVSGDGKFIISDSSGTDTVKLDSSLTAANIFFTDTNNGADLVMTDGVSGDTITLHSQTTSVVENLIFGDGSTLALSGVVMANNSVTTLNGTSGNNILVPSTQNTTIAGKGGNDQYDFGTGMGKDFINNGVSTTNSANGTLFFGHGIADDQLWFDRVDNSGTISTSGNNLRIDIMGSTTSMTINGWYIGGSSTYEQLSEFQLSDSGLKLDSQLANLVSAMATFETNYAAGHGGTPFDPTAVSSITDTTVLSAVSSDWH